MKNNILFLTNKKLSKNYEKLNEKYEIITESNPLKAFKTVLTTAPDVVIFNQTSSAYDGYHLFKLLESNDTTKQIPFILITEKYAFPQGLEIDFAQELKNDSDEELIKKTIEDCIQNNKIDKEKIKSLKPTTKQIKTLTSTVVDEILVKSSIVNEFKSLINNISFDNVLSDNLFKIINKYIPFDVAGVFFNNSDEIKRNVFNLSLPNKNITLKAVDEMRDKFFDEMEKYKHINEIQCNLISGDVLEKGRSNYNSLKQSIIIPFKYGEQLTGGFILCVKKELDLYQNAFLNVIIKELDVVFKIKYLFTEQSNHALFDTMTGLFNKQEFESNLDKEFHRARRYIYNFTLAMIDIDHLSKINETYGKDFGDFVIKELSRLLKEVFRRTDLIYRYGSEEIIILLPSTPITKSVIPIERLRARISEHVFEHNDIKTNITVSVGLCANYSKFTEPEQLLDAVGTALLRAKDGGRNKVDIFE